MIDYVGEKHGRLLIIKEIEKKNKKRRFLCKCECGNTKEVNIDNITSGLIKSCGCLYKETRKLINKGRRLSTKESNERSLNNSRRKIKTESISTIKDLYINGMSTKDLATEYSVSLDTIYNCINEVSFASKQQPIVTQIALREIDITIPNNLKKVRRIFGVRHRQLAEYIGVTRQLVSAWETGKNKSLGKHKELIYEFFEDVQNKMKV